MKIRKSVIRGLWLVVALAAGLRFIAIGSFYALFYSSDRVNGAIVSSGREREYLLYVPAGAWT